MSDKDPRQDYCETVRCQRCNKTFDIRALKEESAAAAVKTWVDMGSLCAECWGTQRNEPAPRSPTTATHVEHAAAAATECEEALREAMGNATRLEMVVLLDMLERAVEIRCRIILIAGAMQEEKVQP